MPEFYKGKIPIIRRSLNEGFLRGIPDSVSTGAVPRDFTVDPPVLRNSPAELKLYDPSEYDALYDKGEEAEDSLEHIFMRNPFTFLDQNGFPDCWGHSVAHTVMMDMLKQNREVPQFNAVALATLIGRLDGGWSGLAMKYWVKHGCPTTKTWKYQSRRGTLDAAEAAQYKIHETWYDLNRAEWDQQMSQRQLDTCLFDNCPAATDYNRAGHAMSAFRKVRIERGHWGYLTMNSWIGFGYLGLCVLDSTWIPDGSCATRSAA